MCIGIGIIHKYLMPVSCDLHVDAVWMLTTMPCVHNILRSLHGI